MNIEEMAAWGEFLGGLAVIAGLLFVGLQLLASNREAKAAANQDYATSISTIGMLLASQGDLAEIFVRGSAGLDELDGADRLRYISFFSNGMFRTYENLFFAHRARRIEPQVWQGAHVTLSAALGTKGVKEIWALRKDWFAAEFQEYVEAIIALDLHSGELLDSYTRVGT